MTSMESNKRHHGLSEDYSPQDQNFDTTGILDVVQSPLTKDELIARIDLLKQEADYQIKLMAGTPEYEAINAISDPDLNGFNYIAAYNHAFELMVRVHKALPGNVEDEHETSIPELYDDVAFMAPHIHEEGVIDFSEQIHTHVSHISPSKRERFAQHPEKWNFHALAKHERERFFKATQGFQIGKNESDVGMLSDLVSSALMTGVYTLLGRKDIAPLGDERAKEVSDKYALQILYPIREKDMTTAESDGELNETIVESYHRALFGENIVDFPAIKKLNDIVGESAALYLKTVAIEGLIARINIAMSQVTDTTEMREVYFHAICTLTANDAGKFTRTSRAALDKISDEILPGIAKANEQIDNLEYAEATIFDEASLELEQVESLNWEVLPPGELEQISREIVRDAHSESNTPTIDLERLKILENIRNRWGAEDCYYARGALSARRTVRDGAKSEADQYLMLILQKKDKNGSVVAEHAIAESPIAGPHALYVFRQDVSEGLDWRDVMSLPKQYARDFGARNVKHSLPRGKTDLVLSMTEKVTTLMAATPEEFHAIEFNGSRGIRLGREVLQAIGKSGHDSIS